MGSFTFKWEHPAGEVYVIGTFDSWTKSIKLERDGDVFQKTVELKDVSEKIYYKFIVDNNWVFNEAAPKEPDDEGNINNFLTPDQIVQHAPAAAIINSVTPASTTAAIAAEPLVETKPSEATAVDEKAVEEKPAGEAPVEIKLTEEKPAEEKPVEEKAIETHIETKGVEKKPAEAPAEASTKPKETPTDIPRGFPVKPTNEFDKPIGINPLPEEVKPEEPKSEGKAEDKADTPVAGTGNGTKAAENGNQTAETKPDEPAANGSTTATTVTTQHRRSSIFSKLKHKFIDA